MKSARKYAYLFCAFAGLLCGVSDAQGQTRGKTTELSVFAGFSNYLGDLAPKVDFRYTSPAGGLAFKRTTTPYFAYSLGFNVGKVSGADSTSKVNHARNLSFESTVFELALMTEFNFFQYQLGTQRRRFTPYLYSGIVFFSYNPKAEYGGTMVALRTLNTEGQGLPGGPKRYSEYAFALPLGGGFKYQATPRLTLLAHSGIRITATDYLDDVSGTYPDFAALAADRGELAVALSDRSGELPDGKKIGRKGFQRGNAKTDDFYFMSGITLSFILNNPVCPSFRRDPFGIF